MYLLFLFLDGVGLGDSDAGINPFVNAQMPNLKELLGGGSLVTGIAPYVGQRVSLLALDACLGVEGLPQSATGQATLLTGQNVPAGLGYHYGPKPNPPTAEYLRNGNLFSKLANDGYNPVLLNAYPPRYFEAIESGHRLFSAIPLAVTTAGINLKSDRDLFEGHALSADFTSHGWRTHLGLHNAPLLTPQQAGNTLAELSSGFDFTFFEYWLSDYAGHRQNMEEACSLLNTFDQVLGGLLDTWDDSQGLIVITSDHGNLEDLSTRRHTFNPVPALIIGAQNYRQQFCENLRDLTDIAPAIIEFLKTNNAR